MRSVNCETIYEKIYQPLFLSKDALSAFFTELSSALAPWEMSTLWPSEGVPRLMCCNSPGSLSSGSSETPRMWQVGARAEEGMLCGSYSRMIILWAHVSYVFGNHQKKKYKWHLPEKTDVVLLCIWKILGQEGLGCTGTTILPPTWCRITAVWWILLLIR